MRDIGWTNERAQAAGREIGARRCWGWAIAVALLLAGCGAPGFPEHEGDAYELVVTLREGAVSFEMLEGATIYGVVDVQINSFVGLERVEYAVASVDRAAMGAPITVTARPFTVTLDTAAFGDGDHELTAVIHRYDGEPQLLRARFRVDNACRAVEAGSPWTVSDIGQVAVDGSVNACNGGQRIIVQASGGDIWNQSDSFTFVHQMLVGDGVVTVRVDEVVAVDVWSKFGLMIRADLSAGSHNAMLLMTDERGVLFQRRETAGGTTDDVLPDGRYMRDAEARAPHWLRLDRSGNQVTASYSSDAVAWTQLGQVSVALPHTAYVGTAVSSRTTSAVASGTFTQPVVTSSTQVVADLEPEPEPEPDPEHDLGSDVVVQSYVPSSENFWNPERGWHGNSSDYARVAREGFSLVRRYVRLDDYRYRALPASLLEGLRGDLARLREHGLKIVLRFSYNFGRSDDAPLSSILMHIEQLTPILQEYADVIAVMQAGFIGAWGEWHSSTNDLLGLSDRRSVTNALLDTLPASRMIQIRYPYYARDQFSTPPSASSAFNGSDASRVGQVNDCFLSTSSDGGTFVSSADYTYMEAVSRYTAMGGETCAIAGLNSRNDGSNALVELERFHYDYLNHDFYEPIIDKWRNQGVFDEISRRLGYRYVLRETVSNTSTRAGGTFSLNAEIENEGFGKLYNPRPINVVLRPVGGGASFTLRASDDARTVLPGPGETVVVPLTVRMPSNLPPGSYTVHLQLPDAASTLRNDPRYSVRFANQGIWNASTGENALNTTVNVD